MSHGRLMSYKKIFLMIGLLMLIFTSARIGWMTYHTPPEHPQAEGGSVDLSGWEFTDDKAITLNGEWEFYPNEFLQPGDDANKQHSITSVPNSWANSDMPPNGYGTYRLNVLLPRDQEQLYGIRMNGVTNAADVYVNGALITSIGHPSERTDEHEGKIGPFSGSFHPKNNELELIVHVSNVENSFFGGINKSVLFGTDEAVHKMTTQSKTLQIVVSIIFILHLMYVFFIYFVGKGKYQKELFYYGLMLTFAAFAILIDDEIIIHLPIGYVAHLKILLITFISTLLFINVFIKHFLQITSKVYTLLIYFYLFIVFLVFIAPVDFFVYIQLAVFFFYLFSIAFLFFHTIQTVRTGYQNSIFILIFITSYTSNMIWGAGINFGEVEIPFYPFDFLIYIISIAFLLFRRHMHLVELNEKQTIQLQEADRVKDEFLANTSHEIRNPLHAMINIAESIMTDGSLSKKHQANMALLIDVGNRLNFTLNDLTAVTQLKEQEVSLQKKSVNIHAVTMLVLNMLDFMKEGKEITLQCDIPANFPNVLADENRLIQILFNLVHNAIKYTEKGNVTVDAVYQDETATIYVKDSGVGIAPDNNIERIFQAYERENEQYASGIGIGLSVSKQLVELHGGTITYVSSKEGTTFMFTIRLASDTDKVTAVTEPAKRMEEVAATTEIDVLEEDGHIAHDRAFVLIVDDDPINIKVLQQILGTDYDVLTAGNGREALQKIEQNRFDLIISDVMMPYMSGYELTQRIREQYTVSELPILLVTARNLQEDIQTAFAAGANDYLTKPVNATELKTRVAALTRLKHSVKELLRFEAAWLQAQIHPHFLFNTLNAIASLAEIDTNRMVSLIEAFGDYLQQSFALTNVEAEIPLSDELALTESYVHIEKERFGDRVRVQYDITASEDILIPPLSIQPLVENAIMHGILEQGDGGTVSIQVREMDDCIEVVIQDDGVGMTEKKIEELLDLQHLFHDGVGVKNTNRRLIQLYGRGLEIKSVVGEGTVVSFRVPERHTT